MEKRTGNAAVGLFRRGVHHRVLTMLVGALAAPALVQAGNSVTWDDIANDHLTADSVLSYGLGTHAQRFSSLDRINDSTVADLVPAWSFSFGDERQRGQESQALVHDGVIYVTGSYSRLFALDARTGQRLWAYQHRLPDDIRPCCDVVNRGAAIYGDKVFFGTLDASVVALDRKTGRVVWAEKFGDHSVGYTMTGAPTIVQDQETGRSLLIHGSSGNEFGIVGKLFARDPDTGEEIWMRPMVEGHMGRLNGEESTPTGKIDAPSWPDDDSRETGKAESWSQGGGAPWQSASFDAETNTIIIGTGNPAPWNTWARTSPGGDPLDYDSLFTSGQAYVDVTTGELVGFYSHTPNDAWDYSGNNEIILFDFEKNGETIRAGAHADRNGFFYLTNIDALTQRGPDIHKQAEGFIAAYPFVDGITWAEGYDADTGRPIEVEGQRPPPVPEGEEQGEVVEVSPPFLGGKNWNPMSYNPDTGLFYIPANHWKKNYWSEQVTYNPGAAYLGMGFQITHLFDDHVGVLRALDPVTGDIVWEHKERMPLWAGTLTTAGNLVFTGTSDGYVKAFHAETGDELWSFQTGSGVVSVPITWEMDGEQYIGIASGYGGAVPLWGGDMADMTRMVSQGGSFWVFKLKE